MSDMAAVPGAGELAVPDAAGKDGWALGLNFVRRYLSPLSGLTLLGVIVIFILVAVLWDTAWLRPYLAAGGAGLAAFLGPLPGIISPESRVKWLGSVLVAALITAGTWLATQDLERRLSESEQATLNAERAVIAAERATVAARAMDQAHDAFIGRMLASLPPQARSALLITAANHLWALYSNKEKTLRSKDHQIVVDMANMLLEVEKDNGHGLYYAGEAYAKLGNFPEMLRMFQHFLAHAPSEKEAKTGQAAECYKRSSGYCAERVGWIAHMVADHYLGEAMDLPEAERGPKLALADHYEEEAVRIEKWPPSHHHKGFDTGGITPGNSSCKILLTVIAERARLGLDPTPVIRFGEDQLRDNCGRWPVIPAVLK